MRRITRATSACEGASLPLVGPAAPQRAPASKHKNLPMKRKTKTIPARGAVQPPVGRPRDSYAQINIQRKETRISDTDSPGSFLDEKMLRPATESLRKVQQKIYRPIRARKRTVVG